MMLKRLASIGVIATLGVLAVNATISVASQQVSDHAELSAKLNLAMRLVEDETPPPGIERRVRFSKTPTDALFVPDASTGRLIVKFRDGVKLRVAGAAQVQSLNGYAVDEVHAILNAGGVTVRSALGKSPEQLASIEQRARDASFIDQPDLAGLLYVEGAPNDEVLLTVARRLNDLQIVEFVEFERPSFPMAMISEGVPDEVIDSRRNRSDRLVRANAIDSGAVVEQVNEQLNLRRSVVATLNLPTQAGRDSEVVIPIEGLPTRLVLEPTPVFARDFQMYVAQPSGELVPEPLDTSRVFLGPIRDMPGGMTAGVLLDGEIFATVHLPDGRRYWVEPLHHHVAEAAPGQHVIYAEDDIDGSCGSCGVTDAHRMLPPEVQEQIDRRGVQGGVVLGGPPCHTELALDLDFPWVERAGSITAAGQLAGGVIAVVNLQYQAEVNINHVITAVIVRATPSADPYVGNNPGDLLEQFRAHWNANFDGVIQYDLAHLLSGRVTGSAIGVAYVGVVCISPNNRYGLSTRVGSFGCQTDLVSHELGHNWNAVHCDCDGDNPDEDFTMNPFLLCANQHADESINQITAFRNFVAAICLDCGGAEPGGGGCGLGANDCLTPSVDPYCNNTQCCATVCAINPSCCSDAWTAACVDLANELCGGGCGEPNAGHCLSANGTPGCDRADCCNDVVAIAPHCEIVWDEECAILAHLVCFLGGDPEAPTPDLTAFQAYRTFDTTPGFSTLTNALLGTGYGGEGFDLPRLIDLGEELLDLGIGEENLAKGKTIRVGVIEDAVYAEHEDLDIIVEPGVTMWLNETFTSPSHGTAVAGIIGSVENDFGMTGIAPDAEMYFFPTFSLDSGGRLLGAIVSALAEFGAGDVLNFSIGFPSPEGFDCADGRGMITASAGVALLIQVGTNIGITSVCSAGNDCCNLDATSEGLDEDAGGSGVFVISACDPGFPYCRRDFSNFSRTPNPHLNVDGTGPHFSAWGVAVASLSGNGDLFGADIDGNPLRSYTTSFGGTSAASPMIAGAVACVQGVSKQFFGIPLSPGIVRGNFDGYPQCGLPQPSPFTLGSCDDEDENPAGACTGDILAQDADPCPGVPNYIAPFPDILGWSGAQITGDWFDSTNLLTDVHVVRGDLIHGNHFSVRNFDGVVLQTRSHFGQAGDHPSFLPPGIRDQVNQAIYRATGQIVDVVGEGTGPEGVLTGLTFSIVATSSATNVVIMEAYDWDNSRWSLVAVAVFGPGGQALTTPEFATFNPERFARDSDRKILVRAWSLGLNAPSVGPGSPTPAPFLWNVDLLDIQAVSSGTVPGD